MAAGAVLAGVEGTEIPVITVTVVGGVNALVIGTTEEIAFIPLVAIAVLGTAISDQAVLADGMGTSILCADVIIITDFQVRLHHALIVHAARTIAKVIAEAVVICRAAF